MNLYVEHRRCAGGLSQGAAQQRQCGGIREPTCSRAWRRDPRGMILDLAGLDYISSAGLRVVLVAAQKGS